VAPGEVDVGKLMEKVKTLEHELQAKTTRVDVAVGFLGSLAILLQCEILTFARGIKKLGCCTTSCRRKSSYCRGKGQYADKRNRRGSLRFLTHILDVEN